MSMYQMIYGANPSTFFILPMLDKHAEDYPRFRDCFPDEREFVLDGGMPQIQLKDGSRKDIITVFTRLGGYNRQDYVKEIEELQSNVNYIDDYDDPVDSTYASFIFKVPKKWKADYKLIIEDGDLPNISEAYKKQLYKIYPKLKEKFDQIFVKDQA